MISGAAQADVAILMVLVSHSKWITRPNATQALVSDHDVVPNWKGFVMRHDAMILCLSIYISSARIPSYSCF